MKPDEVSDHQPDDSEDQGTLNVLVHISLRSDKMILTRANRPE